MTNGLIARMSRKSGYRFSEKDMRKRKNPGDKR
jgi:hypothetical protein